MGTESSGSRRGSTGIATGSNALTDGSTCRRNVVVWLEPGAHYFDFDFYDPGNDRAADNVWTIGGSSLNSVTVVGGTPQGWDPNGGGDQAAAAAVAATKDNTATDAGACATRAQGTELTLGSQSQIEVRPSAHVELCPLHSLAETGTQHLAVFGPKDGDTGPATDIPVSSPRDLVASSNFDGWPPVLAVPGPLDVHDPGCNGTTNCFGSIGGNVDGRRSTTATVTMNIPNRLPQDHRLDSLSLTVWHRETQNGGASVRTLTFALQGLSDVVCSRPVPTSSRWTQATIPCTGAGLSRPAPGAGAIADFQAVLTLRTRGNNNPERNPSVGVQLDQVQLNGTSTAPSVRRERGLHHVARLRGDHGRQRRQWRVGLRVGNGVRADGRTSTSTSAARTPSASRAGVVVHQLRITNLPPTPGFVPISLPHGGIYTKRTVEFAATVGDDSSPTLTARVVFPDSQCLSDILPTPCPGEPAQVRAWQPKK